MEQVELSNNTKLIIKENVLAITSPDELATVSSAFFNGGTKRVRHVLNVGVPKGYSDKVLHTNPLELITTSARKIGVTKNYLAMVTAANVHNFSLVTQKTNEYTVAVAATAGCSHGESSGEEINIKENIGTINIIVFIDGAPLQSCMIAALITATEAKSAALHDFDVRSRYSGDLATGSITDSITVASTDKGTPIILGGPASKFGKLVGYCTRHAVIEALLKQEPEWANRSVFDRLNERHLPVEKLAAEVSKIKGFEITTKGLSQVLKNNSFALASLLAAAKMDDDYKKNLLPTDFQSWNQIASCMGSIQGCGKPQNHDSIELPPFIKSTLIKILNDSL
ncbi:MAG: adenosylcobinamide amidohydrolase [Crenarchaeota archaeon]|nr:adenosylcobinamide amidohydrolase [Thermoproteota archaeon]